MQDRPRIESPFLPSEAAELSALSYFFDRLEQMRGRGLITSEAYTTVVAEAVGRRDQIERGRRFRAAMALVREAAASRPAEALQWAEEARAIEPEDQRTWELAIDLRLRLGREDEAFGIAEEAAARFPVFEHRLAMLSARRNNHGAAVSADPENAPAMAAEASAILDSPIAEDPVRDASESLESGGQPVLAWSSIAAEFLLDHWQKLILCLAVLLIVVSSTVGAHILLGPRLWSPAGKCALALVYTALFAAFGGWLVRWGADRAGRMMLVTTLIVVPVNFMLAGEMRLIIAPSPARLVVLGLDAAALLLITRLVTGVLGLRRAAGFVSGALFALGALNAATAARIPFLWGFAAFSIAPWVYLGAVAWLTARTDGESDDQVRESVYFSLGLLSFAFLSGMLRTAALALPPIPALGAVPVMVSAMACVLTAHRLSRLEKDRSRILTLRFGGFVLSGLAFALVFVRPPGPSPLFSGNTLATALLGLVLYGASLRAYRQPAYLYFAFGALFVGYFGAFYFVVDLVRAVEDMARQALGYRRPLPFAFKSLNGLVFNTGLAFLALWFRWRWANERLARHCHLLGLPFSVAACLLSLIEPKAAVLGLSGYAVLYAAAVVVFAEPRITYLACGAVAGALAFGSTLVPGLGLEHRALGAAALGFTFWAIARQLEWLGARIEHRVPLTQAALVAAVAALVAASASLPTWVSYAAAATFLVAGWTCGLLVRDEPRPVVVHLAIAGATAAWLCGLATVHPGLPLAIQGVAVAIEALVVLALLEWVSTRPTPRCVAFAAATPDAVLVLILLAGLLAVLGCDVPRTAVSLTLVLGAIAALRLTRFRHHVALAYLGLGQAVASALVATLVGVGWADVGASLGALALASAVASLLLCGSGTAWRRFGNHGFFAGPCFKLAAGLNAAVFLLAWIARFTSRLAFPQAALALFIGALTLALLSRVWPRRQTTYAAVVSLVSATYLTLFSVGEPSPDKAYILGLVGVIEALLFWTVGRLGARFAADCWEEIYGRPLAVSSLVLTIGAVLPGASSPLTMSLAAVSFLLMIKSFPSAAWIYAALGALTCAFWRVYLSGLSADQGMAAAVAGAFALWACGVVTRRVKFSLCARFGLQNLAFEFAFFNASAAAATIAAIVRLEATLDGGLPWTAFAGLPLALAPFCVLMLAAYPDRRWIHGAVALGSAGLVMGMAPRLDAAECWLFLAMVLSVVWFFAARAADLIEPAVCRRLGRDDAAYRTVGDEWSDALFALVAAIAVFLIALTTFAAVFSPKAAPVSDGWAWVLATLVLCGFHTAIRRPWTSPDDRLVELDLVLILVVWWLGAPASPVLARLGLEPEEFAAPATAVLAMLTAALATRDVPGGWMWPGKRRFWRGSELALEGDPPRHVSPARPAWAVDFFTNLALGLAVTASAFTRGIPSVTTIATLMLATVAFSRLAIARRRVEAAYLGGLAWGAAWIELSLQTRWPWPPGTLQAAALEVAIGSLAGLFSLWFAAGWLRHRALELAAAALEHVAVFGSLMATAAVIVVASAGPELSDVTALMGVGVLMAVAGFQTLVAGRWRVEWPVYGAQLALLAAYLDYRHVYPVPIATDAALLTLLGYLDLGLAELMHRLRLNPYARPTLYVSLVLPLIPLATAVWNGQLDELNLFLMFTTATFYAVACHTRQWKSLGYGSGVLFNALLWIAWSRVGWRLADHPQFFLVPVGLSTVLFAEVNRRELGRSAVNSIRGAGLVLTYASLATPVWQDQSFASWLTLLLLSLAGVFAGIGLRVQTFLWIGLVGFVLDVVYQLGRMGREHALAKWGIMLALGIVLIVFVALNEKKRIVATMRLFYNEARQWE